MSDSLQLRMDAERNAHSGPLQLAGRVDAAIHSTATVTIARCALAGS